MGDVTADRLVSYAAALRYEDLGPEVVHQVKRLTIDSIGCGLGAFTSDPVKAIRDVTASISSPWSATVLGTREQTTPDMAAFVNGTMVRYLDFNDAYNGADTAHPSDNIPVVLAAAEAYGAPGQELVTGIVLAYEVQSAWADTFGLRVAGPWDQAVYATISTPLGAGKVMDLTEEQMREALRLSMVGGMAMGEARRGMISHWKAAAVPNAGRNGVFAAMLAERGLTGPPAIFNGTHGFFASITGGEVEMEPLGHEGGNGRHFRIMDSRVKRFPSGFFSQTAIEGALEARDALGITGGNDVRRVHIRTFDSGFHVMAGDPTRWHPDTRETADHSIPYVVSCALHFGSLEPSHFEDEMLGDQSLLDLMQKVEVVKDPECQAAWPEAILNIVTVETTDGRSHTARVPYYQGHFKRPMSDQDLENKFQRLTSGLLSKHQQHAALQALWRLDEVDNLTEVMELLVV
ncbi:MAG: MmgE/PrpD family protein [Dehalococcoidia bacterium]